MSIVKDKSDDGTTLTLFLPEKFDFKLFSDFRSSYEKEEKVGKTILDMHKTQYMDSSALGMLLQLKEHADKNKGKISLRNVNKNISDILHVAHFHKLFSIS